MQFLDITDEEIKKAEEILSKDATKISFDDESKNIIKEKDSCFVQACPGSGKTTTVVAKLAILSNKLPHNYEGICVLSHTNVAKDEIKKRLGEKSDRFFKYPNFIGTIQSFVDTYIAIPAMIEKFKVRVNQIDDDKFKSIAYEYYKNLSRSTKNFLYYKDNFEFNQIRYKFDDIEKIIFQTDKNPEYELLKDTAKPTYINLKTQKDNITKNEGIIAYNDAFTLANWYIKKHPEISDAISKRFPYVIIDEVQDTSQNSLKILTTIFKNSTVQYFGDNNQNLYNPEMDVLKEIQKSNNDIKILPINNTYRLSPNICNLSNHVCKNKPDIEHKLKAGKKYLCGNQSECKKCEKCQNTIILYNDDNITQVLPLYAQIIKIQKELKQEMEDCYKFVGQVGKSFIDGEKDSKGNLKVALPNYYPLFNKNISSQTIKYSTIKNFKTILWFAEKYIKDNNFKEAKNILLRGIVRLAHCQGIKEIKSISDIKNYFKNKDDIEALNLFLFRCCDDIKNNNLNYKETTDFLFKLVNKIQDIEQTKTSKEFLQDENIIEESETTIKLYDNIYTDEEIGVKIQICTIASVKGETHDATLLAETFKSKNDLEYFLSFIAGGTSPSSYLNKINNLYVAMTRPKHLLCLAMHEKGFDDTLTSDLENLGWNINKDLCTTTEAQKNL